MSSARTSVQILTRFNVPEYDHPFFSHHLPRVCQCVLLQNTNVFFHHIDASQCALIGSLMVGSPFIHTTILFWCSIAGFAELIACTGFLKIMQLPLPFGNDFC